jgi:hypothetical protein
MSIKRRVRALLDIDTKKIPEVQTRAQSMYDGLFGDKVTYATPNPALPAFLLLIQNLGGSQQRVKTRVVGAVASRDTDRDLLVTGMESQRMYVQILADNDPTHAVALIQNAGLVVATVPVHTKALLTLRLGTQSGTITCDANVGLLVGTGAKKPTQSRFFNWGYTLDGSKTFVSAPSTPTGKTTIAGLPPLTTVGVRVSLTNADGTGAWSDVVTILVR